MTPKQKAAQIYDQYWSDVNRKPVSKQDPLPDIRPLIEHAIIAAVEEDREASAKVADDRVAEIKDLLQDYTPDTYVYNRGVSQIDECELIANRIRARS